MDSIETHHDITHIMVDTHTNTHTHVHRGTNRVSSVYHTEVQTKWQLLCRQHFILRESILRLFKGGKTTMTTRCAPACSQALPVKPQGSGSEVLWPPKSGVSEAGVFRALQPNENSFSLIWKFLCFVSNFIDICTIDLQQLSIGSDNGLALNRRQAIIWTNDGLIY